MFHKRGALQSAADPPTYFPLATSTPFLVTNSGTPSGTVAPWAFQATSSSCGSNTNLLMQWENNSGATPGAAYLTCIGGFSVSDGLGVDGGTPPPYGLAGGTGAQPFNFNSNSGSTATTGFAFNNPECEVGSNADVMLFLKNGTVASWIGCDGSYNSGTGFAGAGPGETIGGSFGVAVNGSSIVASASSALPSTPITGALYSVTGPQGGLVGFGLMGVGQHSCQLVWSYPNLGAGCNFTSSNSIVAGNGTAPSVSSGDLAASENASSGALYLGGSTTNDEIDFGVTTSGVETHSQPVVVPNFKNTGLASSTVSPLCGASGTNEAQCTLTPLFASTGNANAATGTTANTYQQLGSTQSITTGTSNGPNGEWLVKITMPLNVGSTGLSSENVYGCIVSSSTFTVEDATKDGSNTCVESPGTGSFAGTVPFGQTSSSGSSPVGLSVVGEADVIVANSTTLTVRFYVAGSTTTSATVYGYGTIQAAPY